MQRKLMLSAVEMMTHLSGIPSKLSSSRKIRLTNKSKRCQNESLNLRLNLKRKKCQRKRYIKIESSQPVRM